MKRLSLLLFVFLLISALQGADKKMISRYNRLTHRWQAFPEATIHDIQFIPLDSLKKADTIQLADDNRWTLQASHLAYPAPAETCVITALVITPSAAETRHAGLSFTQHGCTLLI